MGGQHGGRCVCPIVRRSSLFRPSRRHLRVLKVRLAVLPLTAASFSLAENCGKRSEKKKQFLRPRSPRSARHRSRLCWLLLEIDVESDVLVGELPLITSFWPCLCVPMCVAECVAVCVMCPASVSLIA